MVLRHEPLLEGAPRLDEDFRSTAGDIGPHRRVRHLHVILVDQSGPHPPCGMALLTRGIEVLAQHLVDQRPDRVHLRRRQPAWCLRRWPWTGKGLTHRASMHPIPGREFTDRQIVTAVIATDGLEQLHSRPQPGPQSPRLAHRIAPRRSDRGGANQPCHAIPGVSHVGPLTSVIRSSDGQRWGHPPSSRWGQPANAVIASAAHPVLIQLPTTLRESHLHQLLRTHPHAGSPTDRTVQEQRRRSWSPPPPPTTSPPPAPAPPTRCGCAPTTATAHD